MEDVQCWPNAGAFLGEAWSMAGSCLSAFEVTYGDLQKGNGTPTLLILMFEVLTSFKQAHLSQKFTSWNQPRLCIKILYDGPLLSQTACSGEQTGNGERLASQSFIIHKSPNRTVVMSEEYQE